MRNFKRAISVIVALIMIIAAVSVPVSAADTVTATLRGRTQMDGGDTYITDLVIDGTIGGIQGTITYDTSLFTFSGISNYDAFLAANQNTNATTISDLVIDNGNGTIKFLGIAPANSSSVWFSVEFTTNETETTKSTNVFEIGNDSITLSASDVEGVHFVDVNVEVPEKIEIVKAQQVILKGASIKQIGSASEQAIRFEGEFDIASITESNGKNIVECGIIILPKQFLYEDEELVADENHTYGSKGVKAVVGKVTRDDISQRDDNIIRVTIRNSLGNSSNPYSLLGVAYCGRTYVKLEDGSIIYSNNDPIDDKTGVLGTNDGYANRSIYNVAKSIINTHLLSELDYARFGHWYKDDSVVYTDTQKVEIVEEGADDAGALHIVNTGDENDMKVSVQFDIPAGTYTLKAKIKGSVTWANQDFSFRESGTTGDTECRADLIPDTAATYSDWHEVTTTIKISGTTQDFMISFSKYNNNSDMLIDNLQILDNSGNDLLEGAGNFGITEINAVYKEPMILESSLNGNDKWYKADTLTYTDTQKVEIVEAGADDKGSLHFVNGLPNGDMTVAVQLSNAIPKGSYTYKAKVKGSVNCSGETCHFIEHGRDSYGIDFLPGETVNYADWTEITGTFESGGSSWFIIQFSQYNNISDLYIDNFQILDANGNDMLNGIGNFCKEIVDSNISIPVLGEAYNDAVNALTATSMSEISISERSAMLYFLYKNRDKISIS